MAESFCLSVALRWVGGAPTKTLNIHYPLPVTVPPVPPVHVQVPFALFLVTHAYFTFYHTMTTVGLQGADGVECGVLWYVGPVVMPAFASPRRLFGAHAIRSPCAACGRRMCTCVGLPGPALCCPALWWLP